MAGIIHGSDVPELDPATFNNFMTGGGTEIKAYFSLLNQGWVIYSHHPKGGNIYQMQGIDAPEWPEVWAEIVSHETAEV